MFLTYKTYLLSIETGQPGNTKDLNSSLESDDWDQYFDIETQTIINPINRNHVILKSYFQFRQLSANKLFKRKYQNQNPRKIQKVDIDIPESIKEEDTKIFEDIETGKIQNIANTNANPNTKENPNPNLNAKVYLYLINLQNIVVTSLIYISHIALIVFLIKV